MHLCARKQAQRGHSRVRGHGCIDYRYKCDHRCGDLHAARASSEVQRHAAEAHDPTRCYREQRHGEHAGERRHTRLLASRGAELCGQPRSRRRCCHRIVAVGAASAGRLSSGRGRWHRAKRSVRVAAESTVSRVGVRVSLKSVPPAAARTVGGGNGQDR